MDTIDPPISLKPSIYPSYPLNSSGRLGSGNFTYPSAYHKDEMLFDDFARITHKCGVADWDFFFFFFSW